MVWCKHAHVLCREEEEQTRRRGVKGIVVVVVVWKGQSKQASRQTSNDVKPFVCYVLSISSASEHQMMIAMAVNARKA